MRGLRSYGLWLSISLSAVLLMAGSGGCADAAEKSGKEAPLRRSRGRDRRASRQWATATDAASR